MKNKNGFTLMELLFVMVILAVLVLIAYPTVLNKYNDAKKASFLTEAKTVINESNKKYSAEHMMGNKIDYIAYNANVTLDLTNNKLKYCVNLEGAGNVKYTKISDGEYFVEGSGDEIKKAKVDVVKHGIFDKFDCDYKVNESDLIDDTPLKFMSAETYEWVSKTVGIIFGVCVVGALLSKKRINR